MTELEARWTNLAEFCEHKLSQAPPGAQVVHIPLGMLREVIACVGALAEARAPGTEEVEGR